VREQQGGAKEAVRKQREAVTEHKEEHKNAVTLF
jgi:hypothetical protein